MREYVGKCLAVEELGEKIIVVGDLHLGYEESMNKTGVFVSRKMYEEMISYFDLVFAKIGKVDKIVLLGDVKHAFGNILRQEWNDVLGLIDYFEGHLNVEGEIVIVKGNHDVILEPILRQRERVRLEDYFIFGKYCFLHGHKDFEGIWDLGVRVFVMGHGHPAVKISDGVKVEKYKCFLVGKFKGKEVVVLPSFFEYSVGSDPRENELGLFWDFKLEKFDVKIVSEGLEVLDFGMLGEL